MSNFIRSTALFAVASSCLFAITSPAHAQESYAGSRNPMVKTDHLPQTKFNTSRLQVDVVDENPIWHNCVRPPSSGPNLDGMKIPMVIPVSPSGSINVPVLTESSGNGLPPGARTGNPMIPNLNQLPQSGFGQSNIPNTGIHPQSALPKGTTAHVMSRLAPTGLPSPSAHQSPGNAIHPALAQSAHAPVLMTYKEPAGSVGTH